MSSRKIGEKERKKRKEERERSASVGRVLIKFERLDRWINRLQRGFNFKIN